ncbi:phosphate ABC transporter permease PstA [Marinomonas mediterranea]|uniref:Phosphate transport system permease protein PstA n=1 Tax=Marinomonas mediterranea (strain ATCC 700492 / JCM 21426 / NBRC 103028 / MMB-1) TaxID=717774 RepID=F2K109_MARM1|nr:phosphate ABC transporter, inner membrane subunit PstA [Marinomonas mediterranea MMB-1]WCN11504.1 phosphate ABC transporter permease PstA [Marinomonas mediterranea]WCN19669.1 phosphate ABC transporter permease PstA [Marinomonas mediterranea MMB-1]
MKMKKQSVSEWVKSGDPWVWLNAGAVAISVIMVIGLLLLIAVRGLGHFWPADVVEATYELPGDSAYNIVAERVESVEVPAAQLREAGVNVEDHHDIMMRTLMKTGNRDVYGSDFRWVVDAYVTDVKRPEMLFVAERHEWGNLYGYLKVIKENGQVVAQTNDLTPTDSALNTWAEFEQRIDRATAIHDEIYEVEKHDIGKINYALERLRLEQRRYELNNSLTPARLADLNAERAEYDEEYKGLQSKLADLYQQINRDSFIVQAMDGSEHEIQVAKVVRAYRPNAMGIFAKLGFYGAKLGEFLTAEPREANTEGGVFPAIFGTVMMVMLMTVIVTPFGVVAAVYLREYASQGVLTRTIRIAVNNLAGVPSIVYGVFGLGFFIYFLGSGIDQAFFPEALPSPTFGTGGLMWASITLALLTVPVVIVATEEGLSRIPRNVREGSLALGATKAETLWRVILPMCSPAIMTGVILAVARAAGEVAPLMLVGVVKLAPSLPLDGNYPFIHLDQKFMHLGFHIYDVGFQSPNVEAARPLVYATALLLVIVIALLNLAAVTIRNHLREKYKSLEM